MLNSSAQPTTAPRTVLVVEDEPTLATAIAQRITAEGWTARVASDGASAVQAATTLRPDLVIMDIMLPVRMVLRPRNASWRSALCSADPDGTRRRGR